MELYQQIFQNCSYLSIPDEGVKDLQTCLRQGHVFYEKTLDEINQEALVIEAEGGLEGRVNLDSNPAEKIKAGVMGLNATKAGMTGFNVDEINAKIMQISEGSKFHEHKKKHQRKIDKRVEDMKRQLSSFTPEQIQKAQNEVDALVQTIEAGMDLSRYYVHLDMDAFFASVEMRDDPSLRNVPMAVGGDSMLSTSNYVARTFGVRAAMPGFIARKLCPGLKIVPCNYPKYRAASKLVEAAVKPYDEEVRVSMDEIDLDITDLVIATVGDGQTPEDKRMRDTCAYNVVKEIRDKIVNATQLTASAGIAPTRFLAKLCSDIRKPNGQLMLANRKQSILAFLSMIPVRKVNGIGAVTEQLLKGIDIVNCKNLWDQRAILSMLFKKSQFQDLLGISIGTGGDVFRKQPKEVIGDRKSLSCERTFTATADHGFLEDMCQDLSSELEKDLKAAGLCAKTITLKIKTTDFDVRTRARSIMQWTDSAERIHQEAWRVYLSYVAQNPELAIRLLGIRVTNFKETNPTNNLSQKTISEFFSPSLINLIPALQKTHGVEPVIDPNERTDTIESGGLETDAQECSTNIIVRCPVCKKDFRLTPGQTPEQLMDMHIDDCLSKNVVREVRSQIVALPPPKKRISCSAAGSDPKRAKLSMKSYIDTYFSKLEK